MPVPIFQVDAFTAKPFAGNPAAVCLLDKACSDEWMHNVAREMNLSETAFVRSDGDIYDLRWFTPAVEVDLCGHATLASAHVLWESGRLERSGSAKFQTRSGLLTASPKGDWIEMNFPATPEGQTEAPPRLAEALGCVPEYIGKNRFDYLVEVGSEEIVRSLRPDFRLLSSIAGRGFIVTSRSTGRYDFVSRFFAPAAGIDEDPVTGSAHCCLGPFWGGRLGKSSFLAYQASARGGEVRVEVKGERIHLGGQAVTVVEGRILSGTDE